MNRRVVVLSATCAVVLGATGIAIAASHRPAERQLQVVDKRARVRTSPTDETPTVDSSTTESNLTTATGFSTGGADPEVVDSTTTTAIFNAPLAGATDLEGTISIPPVLVAEEDTPLTLTVRNAADHPLALRTDVVNSETLGIALDGSSTQQVALAGIASQQDTLAVGEQRTFTMNITPQREAVGPATAYAAMTQFYFLSRGTGAEYAFSAIPKISVMVVPPGVDNGGPLDATLGKWRAEISSDASAVALGETFVVHADLTNVGDRPQTTDGYGAVAIGCGGYIYSDLDGRRVGSNTIEPGATKSFDFEFVTRDAYATTLECFAGINFYSDFYYMPPRAGFETNILKIAVLRDGTTTTSRPSVTTTAP